MVEEDPVRRIPPLGEGERARLEGGSNLGATSTDPAVEETLQLSSGEPEKALSGQHSRNDPAVEETLQLTRGLSERDLSKEAKENEHDRSERFRDHFELLASIGLKIAFWVSVFFGLAWAWHLLAPVCWHWLTPEQLDHLQNLIAGGVVASLAAEHFRRRLSPK